MGIRIAFAGFRHGHIFELVNKVKEHSESEIVGACEEDETTRKDLTDKGLMDITHENYSKMLKELDCDVIAIGDVYAKRGQIAIEALEAGKHVIADKPLCCKLSEFEKIKKLSEEKKLSVGCQLTLRGSGALRTVLKLISENKIGEVHTVTFTGQHPRSLGVRPDWYFVPGMHGGTINDIAIHGIDAILWLTGRNIVEVVGARVWNARTKEYPHFQDGAQMMLKLDNGGGVLSDVSYLAPEGIPNIPGYWRFTIHGSHGQIETTYNGDSVLLGVAGEKELQKIPSSPELGATYYDDFVNEIKGNTEKCELTTEQVLHATYVSLVIQQAADEGKTNVLCDYK